MTLHGLVISRPKLTPMRRRAALAGGVAAFAVAVYVGARNEPPSEWTVERPREPVTVRARVAIGLDATTRTTASDYRIIDSGDSSVILHGDAHGSSVRRFEIVRAGSGNTVEWAKHGIYAKVRNALLEDVRVSVSESAADCFTLRMAGAVVRRFVCEGSPPHVATYYQESDLGGGAYTSGAVELRHGRGTFRGDTAFWIAVNGTASIRQAFVFQDIHVVGPERAAFLRVLESAFTGSVTISGCSTLNGRPVSAADVSVPASAPLRISCP